MYKKNNLFIAYQGSECLLSCFINYFKNNGLKIDETFIYFLGNGFVNVYEKKENCNQFEINLRSHAHEAIYKFCVDYNIKVQSIKSINSIQAQEILELCIASKDAIIIKVDAQCLKYNSAFENSCGIPHYILIIDRFENEVLICDGFIATVPPSNYLGWCKYDEIIAGREKVNNECIIIENESLKYLKCYLEQNDITDCLYDRISQDIKFYLEGGKIDGKYYGICAAKEFLNDIPHLMDYFGTRYSKQMFVLNNKMRIWGLITSRILLIKALEYINIKRSNSVNNIIISGLKKTHKNWDCFCFQLIKAGLSKNKKDLDTLSFQLNEIITEEVKCFKMIIE